MTAPTPPPATPSGPSDDERLAQQTYEREIGGLHSKVDGLTTGLTNLTQSVADLARKVGEGFSARPAATQPSGTPSEGTPQAPQQQPGTPPAHPTPQPERPPKPTNWWFKELGRR